MWEMRGFGMELRWRGEEARAGSGGAGTAWQDSATGRHGGTASYGNAWLARARARSQGNKSKAAVI